MTSPQPTAAVDPEAEAIDNETFKKCFDKAYNTWFRWNLIAADLRKIVESYEVTAEEFEQLAGNRQSQRYIALINGRIRFDELSGPPHGAIIGRITKLLGTQLDGPNGVEMLCTVNDDDVRLNNRSIKRPDASYKIRRSQIPQQRPAWLKFQPNGHPYPNVVIEVSVNHEEPQRLLADMQRYFTPFTSTRVWIGVKYWTAERKFWVGWAERRRHGVGGRLHTQMSWPPDHHDINVATNIVYNIPMTTIYGPNIPMPQGLPLTVTLDTDIIRLTILDEV